MKIIEKGIPFTKVIETIIYNLFHFKKDDWHHVWWLFKNMIKQFIAGDMHETEESWIWLKIHCCYKSTRVK